MKRLLLIALLVLGCYGGKTVDGATDSLIYAHDEAHHVSCWTWQRSGGGIACVPDSEVTQP